MSTVFFIIVTYAMLLYLLQGRVVMDFRTLFTVFALSTLLVFLLKKLPIILGSILMIIFVVLVVAGLVGVVL